MRQSSERENNNHPTWKKSQDSELVAFWKINPHRAWVVFQCQPYKYAYMHCMTVWIKHCPKNKTPTHQGFVWSPTHQYQLFHRGQLLEVIRLPFKQKLPKWISPNHSHRIHVWHIYPHLGHLDGKYNYRKYTVNICKYTIHGSHGIVIKGIWQWENPKVVDGNCGRISWQLPWI